MTDEELLARMKRVDPQTVRLPPGIKTIAAEGGRMLSDGLCHLTTKRGR